MSNKWTRRFLDVAFLAVSWSKDPSNKVGVVIVNGKRIISMGFNGFPAGTVDDYQLYENRERKYLRVVHAEKNAILFARQDLNGFQLYSTHFPCCQCTAFIIQSGIASVIVPEQSRDYLKRWFESIRETLCMMEEAGIRALVYEKETDQLKRFLIFNESQVEDY